MTRRPEGDPESVRAAADAMRRCASRVEDEQELVRSRMLALLGSQDADAVAALHAPLRQFEANTDKVSTGLRSAADELTTFADELADAQREHDSITTSLADIADQVLDTVTGGLWDQLQQRLVAVTERVSQAVTRLGNVLGNLDELMAGASGWVWEHDVHRDMSVLELGRALVNSMNGTTRTGLEIARLGGAECHPGADGIIYCTGNTGINSDQTFTVGNVVITPMSREQYLADPDLVAHEARHATQWAVLGPAMGPLYGLESLKSWLLTGDYGSQNGFERGAGLEDGGYTPAPIRIPLPGEDVEFRLPEDVVVPGPVPFVVYGDDADE